MNVSGKHVSSDLTSPMQGQSVQKLILCMKKQTRILSHISPLSAACSDIFYSFNKKNLEAAGEGLLML